jgi:hypothetical protein
VRRKWFIERPVIFGCFTATTSVIVGILQDKTMEQQALNVVLGFTAGALLSCLILLIEWMVSRRDPS